MFLLSAAAGLGGCGQTTIDSNQLQDFIDTAPVETGLREKQPFPFDFSPDRPLLRYRFRKGEELRWVVQHILKMRTIIGGMEENVETISRATKIWKTLDVDASGAATFEYRVENIDMRKAKTGHDDVVFNSCRDRILPFAFNNLEGKIGVPLAHIRIGTQGQTQRRPLQEYAGSLSENRIVIPLPDEPVEISERWSEPKQIELPQPNQTIRRIRVRNDFTLEHIHGGLATIRFAAFALTPLTPQEESQLLENFSQGTMELDLQAGHFIRLQATVDRLIVGIRDASDSIRHLSRVTSCCCGRRACEVCSS